jgi:hypothetical protein
MSTSYQPTHLVILVQLTSEDGAHMEFRNVVGKLASYIVQKPKNQETDYVPVEMRCSVDPVYHPRSEASPCGVCSWLSGTGRGVRFLPLVSLHRCLTPILSLPSEHKLGNWYDYFNNRLEKAFQVLRFSPVIIILPMLRTHASIYRRRCIDSTTGSVVKYNTADSVSPSVPYIIYE